MIEGLVETIGGAAALRLILGKYGSEAIGQLVGGVTGIPLELLNQHRQRIADGSAARSKITATEADIAADALKADQALRARAVDRWLGVQGRAQVNREAVAVAALEDLRENPSTAEAPVDPDFMAQLEDYAERATSPDMQRLLGRILAGEIHRPATFSLRTLQLLSVLDQPTAKALEQVAAWLCDGEYLAKVDNFLSFERWPPINQAMQFGFLSTVESTVNVERTDGKFWLSWPDHVFVVALKDQRVHLTLPIFQLTSAGAEILTLLKPPPSTSPDQMFMARGLLVGGDHIEAVEHGPRAASVGNRGVAYTPASKEQR